MVTEESFFTCLVQKSDWESGPLLKSCRSPRIEEGFLSSKSPEGNIQRTKIESPPFYFFSPFLRRKLLGDGVANTKGNPSPLTLHPSDSCQRRRKSDVSDRELACLGRKHLYEIGEGRANSFEEEIPLRPSSNKGKKSPSLG